MRTIDLLPGTTIEDAALMLVAAAPARADFNGIRIRAKYATTNPRDIAAQYHWTLTLRAITFAHSPAGKRLAAEQEARKLAAQTAVDACLSDLTSLDFESPTAVLAWVERVANAADHIGVVYDRGAVAERFAAAGWSPGVNCGPAFDGDDARNYAGWIVGQWLSSGYPNVGMFAEKWRARFASPVN